MPDPTVCAVMLTRDRPELARRAVECFRAQAYDPAKRMLLILDSGEPSWYDMRSDAENEALIGSAVHADKTIGALRNIANACCDADIIIHFDDDDWSHPNRIAEQVALLQASGVGCVGYRDCLFWRMPDAVRAIYVDAPDTWDGAQAWLLYNTIAIGSSFCYWRKVWRDCPFPDLPKRGVKDGSSEDVVWRREVYYRAVSSVGGAPANALISRARTKDLSLGPNAGYGFDPRMICRIHGKNTSSYEIEKYPDSWRRVPSWDDYCRNIMERKNG